MHRCKHKTYNKSKDMNCAVWELHFIEFKGHSSAFREGVPIPNRGNKFVNGLAHVWFNYLSLFRTGNLIILCCFLYRVERDRNTGEYWKYWSCLWNASLLPRICLLFICLFIYLLLLTWCSRTISNNNPTVNTQVSTWQ